MSIPLLAALAAAAPAGAPAQVAAADALPARLVGTYNGAQMELAAGLELASDGRFRYAASYGALDEEARGRWTFDGRQVLLTSDPLSPPRFILLDRRDAPAGRLAIGLDLPDGLSRQYFHAEIRLADGRLIDRQLSDSREGEALGAGDRPVAVTLVLPIFGLRGEPTPLPGASGHDVRFRFEPNDLGKVAFARTPLAEEQGELILERYQRTIRFRRIAVPRGAGAEADDR